MRSVVVVLFVAVAFFATGDALQCYQCDMYTKACSDKFDKSGTGVKQVTCSYGYDVCIKEVLEYSNKTVLTQRGCVGGNSRANERGSNLAVITLKIHYCNEDLCNGVSTTRVTLSSLIVLVVPFIFGRYY